MLKKQLKRTGRDREKTKRRRAERKLLRDWALLNPHSTFEQAMENDLIARTPCKIRTI
jgi:hypothetical protein